MFFLYSFPADYPSNSPVACSSYRRKGHLSPDNTHNSQACFYINVGQPTNTETKKPLFFYITDDDQIPIYSYNVQALAESMDMTVVIPEYRKGILGFWSETDKNAGYYDVVNALNYTLQNFENSIDLERIVVVGNGVGASIASKLQKQQIFDISKFVILSGPVKNSRTMADSQMFIDDLVQRAGLNLTADLNQIPDQELVNSAGSQAFHYYTLVEDEAINPALKSANTTIIYGFTGNEGTFDQTLDQVTSVDQMHDLIYFEMGNYQNFINNNRINYATLVEYISQGKTYQERQLLNYYKNWAYQFFGDAFVGSEITVELYDSEDDMTDKYFLFHNTECLTEEGFAGQPARSIGHAIFGGFMENGLVDCENSDISKLLRKIILDDLVNDNLNLPKFNTETEAYVETTVKRNSVELTTKYWPYRRPHNYFNHLLPLMNQPNKCNPILEQDTENVYPEVKIDGTSVIGQKVVEYGQNGINAWYGLPYGVLAERFERAIAPDYSKTQTIRANRQGKACVQSAEGFITGKQIEDCFTLDIIKSINDETQPMNAVIVYFCDGPDTQYGNLNNGGRDNNFCGDSTESFLGNIAQDIRGGTVIVKVNYRTGLLANLGGRNLGLSDAEMALEFVFQHIGKFGGDSSKITLMGQGIGAVTSAILATKFSSVISGVYLMSGTFSSPWAYTSDPEVTLNCVLDNFYNSESLEDLKSVDIKYLMGASVGCPAYNLGFYVNKSDPNSNLRYHPADWLQENSGRNLKFSVVLGFNEHESYNDVIDFNPRFSKHGFIFKYGENIFQEFIKNNPYHQNAERSELEQELIFNHYYPFSLESLDNIFQRRLRETILDMYMDEKHVYPMLKDLKTINNNNAWLYKFTVTPPKRSDENRASFNAIPYWISALHNDYNNFINKVGNEKDRVISISNNLVCHLGNFVQHQNPQIIGTSKPDCNNYGWQNYKQNNGVLVIRNDENRPEFLGTGMHANFKEREYNFWENLEAFRENSEDEVTTVGPEVTTSPDSASKISLAFALVASIFVLI